MAASIENAINLGSLVRSGKLVAGMLSWKSNVNESYGLVT